VVNTFIGPNSWVYDFCIFEDFIFVANEGGIQKWRLSNGELVFSNFGYDRSYSLEVNHLGIFVGHLFTSYTWLNSENGTLVESISGLNINFNTKDFHLIVWPYVFQKTYCTLAVVMDP
jgi:hypothetical protein